jgi:hypothetical protein
MGTLVFQATLGGAVNIIGPNIANTINFTLPSADGTSGQTWTTNGSGVLAFGTLGIAGGGTGQITATAAFNALAPSQSGQSGKYLTTDGTNTSWGTNPLGTVTSVAVSGGTTGLTTSGGPITTSGTITFAGTLATSNGGTGLSGATPFTSGGVVYASSSSALATGSALQFNGTAVGIGGSTITDVHLLNIQGSTAVNNVGIVLNKTNATAQIWGIANSGALTFYNYTNSSEAARFDTSNNFGIGTSSPSKKLDVVGTIGVSDVLSTRGTSGASDGLKASQAIMLFDISAANWAGIQASNSGNVSISAGDTTINTWVFNYSNGALQLPKLLDISAASAGQIKFPATQNASANANTLDDYEEGTWTPTITFGAGSTGITYSLNEGFYTKIGTQVFLTGVIQLSSKGSATGYADIRGLPFTVQNASGAVSVASMRFVNISFSGAFEGFAATNTTLVSLSQISTAGTVADLTDVNFSNNSSITFSVNYRV